MQITQYSLIIYDTSDFEKFPIGGQLTSIRNFLRFIAEQHPDKIKKILLVGVTTEAANIYKLQEVRINNAEFDFFPVLYRKNTLSSVQKSMRAEYLKALCGCRKYLPHGRDVVHYIHTPEAFIYLKVYDPFCKTAVFSHGSFFNMVSGFRFYKRSRMIGPAFNCFLKFMLRKADLIFTLDKISSEEYRPYNKNIVQVDNSIVLPDQLQKDKMLHDPVRLLFVGRLSKVKRVDSILKAVVNTNRAVLTVVGDGEEKDKLEKLSKDLKVDHRVRFLGGVNPNKIGEIMAENDILILNSTMEGKPMALIEALSYGLPVVTTSVGGISEIICDGADAFITDGTPATIQKGVDVIRKNYKFYHRQALHTANSYDYKIVNKIIFRNLQKLYSGLRR